MRSILKNHRESHINKRRGHHINSLYKESTTEVPISVECTLGKENTKYSAA